MVVLLTSCGADSTYDGLIPEEKPDTTTHTPTPDQQRPTDPTFRSVVQEYYNIAADANAVAKVKVQLTDNSIVERELRFKLGIMLQGPDSLVVEDAEATVYTGAGRPVATEGNWTLSGKDSVKNETCVSKFSYSYYQVSVTTVNTVGKTMIGGKWVPYMRAYLTTTAHRFNSEWETENVVRNDSIFRREKTMNEFNVTARWDGGERSFILSKEVVIDHFVKLVEPEEPEVEEPTPTVTADYWITGLKTFVSGSRVYREDSKTWSDAYLFECEDSYYILLANYKLSGDTEVFTSFEEKVVSKSTSPYSSKYNGVTYYNGGFYPAVITAVNGNYKNGWTLIAVVNGATVSKNHDATASGVAAGIKNFQGNDTAYPTPIIPTTPSVKEVNGKLVITFTGKTSVHTVTKTVARR